MTPLLALLTFLICGPSDALDRCEHGEVRARDCAAAEAYVRAGMREGQTLTVLACGAAP